MGLWANNKDKGKKGLKIKIKDQILFKFRFLITCFPSYPEFSRLRVQMQNLEGGAQIDGSEEATRKSAWPLATLLPQKCGYGRVSAAVWIDLATRFRGRVVLRLYV